VLAPARWEKRAAMALANTYIAAYCAADPRREFVDVNAAMLTPEGEPRPELFVDDRLHMSPAGYAIWKRVVGERVWRTAGDVGRVH
jgi:lysophospholipase L1-like esterase